MPGSELENEPTYTVLPSSLTTYQPSAGPACCDPGYRGPDSIRRPLLSGPMGTIKMCEVAKMPNRFEVRVDRAGGHRHPRAGL